MEEEKKLSLYKIIYITDNGNYYFAKAKCSDSHEALKEARSRVRTQEWVECECPNGRLAGILSSKISEIIIHYER